MKNQKVITALTNFKAAYNELNAVWHEMPFDELTAISKYPFDRSFDELNVNEWINEMVNELSEAKYKIVSHDYVNAGGGNMVSTFQIWLPAENKTVFLHVNEEGGTLATCDYISNDIEFEYDMMIADYNIDTLQVYDDYFELFRYCQLEYIKRSFQRYRSTAYLRFELLSKEMQNSMTAEERQWHIDNVSDTFETNGFNVIKD